MTKSDLIDRVASGMGVPRKSAEDAVNALFDRMVEALRAGERIEIRGFGSFTTRQYGSYFGRNPRTGAVLPVAEKRLPFFKAGKELRQRVLGNSPSSPETPARDAMQLADGAAPGQRPA